MKTKLRYPAFTLLELTIALLIAAVCLGIAFYVLRTFNQIGSAQQRERQQDLAIRRFWHRMQKETLDAQRIWYDNKSLQLERDAQWTAYDFLDSAIVRRQNDIPTDTLSGRIGGLVVDYVPDLQEPVVRSVHFELQTERGSYPFVLQKIYSAEELVHLSETLP